MELTEAFTLLLSPGQKEAIRHAAFEEHKSMGELVRSRLFSDADLADKASLFGKRVRESARTTANSNG